MSKGLITGTTGLQGQNIFISPENSSMAKMSYGRIRLDDGVFVKSIPGSALNFVWMMAAHREVVDRQCSVVKVDSSYA